MKLIGLLVVGLLAFFVDRTVSRSVENKSLFQPSTHFTFRDEEQCIGNLTMLYTKSHPHAVCLDGTPSGFYFKQSTTGNKNYVIHLQGGGECVDEAGCKKTARGDLGSSKNWPASRPLVGLLGCNPLENRDFHDWNKVYVAYGSGDLFLGQETSPNKWGLQFSGFHQIKAVLDTLIQFGDLTSAKQIILTGQSAGAIGAGVVVDYIFDSIYLKINKKFKYDDYVYARNIVGQTYYGPRVELVSIAGYYFSNDVSYVGPPRPIRFIPWKYDDLKVYQALWSAYLPERCVNDGRGNIHECIFAARNHLTLETPTFYIQPQTDSVVLPIHEGMPALWLLAPPNKKCNQTVVDCPETMVEYMTMWTEKMINAIQAIDSNPVTKEKHGYFLPSCLLHVEFSTNFPVINGYNYLYAVSDWRNKSRRVWKDSCPNGGLFCGQCAPM